MNFKLESEFSVIDYHLNDNVNKLVKFARENYKDLTQAEYDALMEAYNKFDEALMIITDKL